MNVGRIDHLNIATGDLDATRRFYREVLGFTDGPRPPFQRPGAWMYAQGHPVLHISTGRTPSGRGRDAVNHVAFASTGLRAMRDHLQALGIAFQEFAVPDQALHQIFLHDPNGLEIELIYSGEEAAQALRDGASVDATTRSTHPRG